MKFLSILFAFSFSLSALARIEPAKIIKIKSDRFFPAATYTITYEVPCIATDLGGYGKLEEKGVVVLGVLLKVPDTDIGCEAMPRRKTTKITVSAEIISDHLVLGNSSSVIQ